MFMPVTTLLIYVLSTPQGAPPFWENPGRMDGWTHLTFIGLLLAPWTAFAAIVRQKEAFARDQELTFALERSELERQALDARLAPAAGAGRAAFPLQHARERAGAGRCRLAACVGRAAQPHRVSARGGAAAPRVRAQRSSASCSWFGHTSS